MVHIVNRLPKAVGGDISSGDNPIYFAKDSNWLGEYEYKVFENIKKILRMQGRHVASVNDDGFHSYPISIFFNDGLKIYTVYYYNKDKLQYLTNIIVNITNINFNPFLDQFGAVGKNLFAILNSDPKSIYYFPLIDEDGTVTPIKLDYIYNTWGGNEKNLTIKEPSILNILDNYLIFFGGLHDSSAVKDYNLMRIYYWSEEEHKLKYISSFSSKETSPYKETGYFYQVSNSDIVGVNCNYTGNSGFNVYYHFEKASDLNLKLTTRRYYIFREFSNTNIMYGSDYEKTGAWFWKNQLRMVSYKSGSDRHTHFSNEGSAFYDSTEFFTYPALIMGVNDSQFLYLRRETIESCLSTKLILCTINGNSLLKEELLSYNVQSLLIKIPGVPIIYYDTDTLSLSGGTYFCSLIKGFPILLTSGSTINGKGITSTYLSFPKNGFSLKIHLNTGGLNGHIYSQRNDDEGYII